jgi:hypothetical protein
LQSVAERNGFRLDREKLGEAALPNGIGSLTCYSWLLMYFKCSGDDEPNQNEIHIDPIEEKTIHKEYLEDLSYYGRDGDAISYSQFCEVSLICYYNNKQLFNMHCVAMENMLSICKNSSVQVVCW